ncbi:MAG: hypothetical protein WDW36_004705 [Sanguina aurantia]
MPRALQLQQEQQQQQEQQRLLQQQGVEQAQVEQLHKDAGLGRRLQPLRLQPREPPPDSCRPLDPGSCASCRRSVLHSPYITAMGKKWHISCFKCTLCQEQIQSGTHSEYATGAVDGLPYHPQCHRLAFNPVCAVCRDYIPEGPHGLVEYNENVFWREKYCAGHEGGIKCCACSRHQPRVSGQEWVLLTDGRQLCLQCVDTMVVDTQDAQPLYNEILSFYVSLGLPHPEKPPLMLVDAPALNDFSVREGRDVAEEGPALHVRGLCMATVYRSVPSIVRAGREFSGGSDVQVSNVSTASQSVRCKVTAVLVMYGLPRLLTGCILAHELMHAWLRMRNIASLDARVEEGLCQLIAALWLDRQHGEFPLDGCEQRLASYFSYQIRQDPSVIYGDGFREAYEAFQLVGLTAVVDSVVRHGRLTP